MNIKPLHDLLLLEPDANEGKSSAGIIIPENAQKKPQRGTVISVGPGTKDVPMTVVPGDTVLYRLYAGTELSLEGKDYIMLRETDILAIF